MRKANEINTYKRMVKTAVVCGSDGPGMWRVWGMGELCTGFWWGSLREGDHWGDPDVDGRIILKWIFRKLEGVAGTCGYGNELSGSINLGNLLTSCKTS
jgi:hypothetical protein